MLFFNTEFDIYPNSQSPDFKPDTVSQSPDFKPDIYLKAQALNLTLYLKARALNLALYLKAQALNLALTPFTYPIFTHKLSKKKKKSKQPTILSSKNYVTLILYP